ncbi:hypothetical protein [Lacinutrix salivirga]
MKNIIIAAFLILGIVSCKNDKNNAPTKPPVESKDIVNEEELARERGENLEYYDTSNVTLKEDYEVANFYNFSSLESKDEFMFILPKGNINDTETVFTIKNSEGKVIHTQRFKTIALVSGYATTDMFTDNEVIEHIKSNLFLQLSPEVFFNTETTDFTAVLPYSENDLKSNKPFLEVKNQKLPLYKLKLGNENSTYYGYSKSDNKVVSVFECC